MSGKSPRHTTTGQPATARLEFTPAQEQVIHRAACEIVLASLEGRTADVTDLTAANVDALSVMGAFVTLRRHGHLRACCGTLGQPMRLDKALQAAAFRTATCDTRLPPISLTELPHLTLDVSLLHDFQRIASRGPKRVNDVTVGRHGLTIRREGSAGLLLPGVPVDLGWDAESFLRQVCRKAGLPSTAWQDDSAELETFEAHVIESLFDASLLDDSHPEIAARFSRDELVLMADHCRGNILALLTRATPNYYLSNCNDTTVQGVALSVSLPGRSLETTFTQISIRPGLPLQATLFQLAESGARWLSEQNLPLETWTELQTELVILYDSAMHGTVADPDLTGLNPKSRAIMMIEQDRNAWQYDPQMTADQLFTRTLQQMQIVNPRTAGVFSFAIDTQATDLGGSSASRTATRPEARPPAVAGTFYPDDPDTLAQLVDELLGGQEPPQPEPWPAVVVPHAGLQYSGRLAAQVLQQVIIPPQVIILAPKHHRLGAPWAVAPHDHWLLPGNSMAADPELAQRLADGIDGLQLDASAHQQEHAIEIELPILARLAPAARVTGIVIGGGDLDRCRGFARQLAAILESLPASPLLIASTDMNHFATDPENRRLDQLAIDALKQLDPDLLYATAREHHISMCGLLPTVIVMLTLQYLDRLKTCRQIGYATSAEVSGDTSRVVGYAGILLG